MFQAGRPADTDDLIRHTVASAVISPGMQLLDAGCGAGGLLSQFDPDWKTYGIDLYPEAIELSQKRKLKSAQSNGIELFGRRSW